MGEKTAYLVVGGDSMVGQELLQALHTRGHVAYGSTRRIGAAQKNRILIDFENEQSFTIPNDIGYAYIIAAATNYDRCENDPLAHKINTLQIPKLVESLLLQGVFVSFISTNSLFGGDQPWPNEDAPHAPRIAYAKQKAIGELACKAAARKHHAEDRFNIVRLTKVLNATTAPIPGWLQSWGNAEPVHVFSDLIFAPISVQFAAQSLAILGERRIVGDLHLSGKENVNYVEFAQDLADKLGHDRNLVKTTTSTERGVHLAFKPKFSGLGMVNTIRRSGIHPQPLLSVIEDIKSYLGDAKAAAPSTCK